MAEGGNARGDDIGRYRVEGGGKVLYMDSFV